MILQKDGRQAGGRAGGSGTKQTNGRGEARREMRTDQPTTTTRKTKNGRRLDFPALWLPRVLVPHMFPFFIPAFFTQTKRFATNEKGKDATETAGFASLVSTQPTKQHRQPGEERRSSSSPTPLCLRSWLLLRTSQLKKVQVFLGSPKGITERTLAVVTTAVRAALLPLVSVVNNKSTSSTPVL